MIELKIIEIDDDRYLLQDINTKEEYTFYLTFYDAPKIDVGDALRFNEKLLDELYEEYSKTYRFGPIDGVYGRKISSRKDIDLIYVVTKDGITNLKRFYG